MTRARVIVHKIGDDGQIVQIVAREYVLPADLAKSDDVAKCAGKMLERKLREFVTPANAIAVRDHS